MFKQLMDPHSRNSTISHSSKHPKPEMTLPLGPLRLSSLANSLPNQNLRSKEKPIGNNESQRLLQTLKRQELTLLMNSNTPNKTEDVQKLIEMLLVKKIGPSSKMDQNQGLRESMIHSVCLRMLCNNVLQDLQQKGRLGHDLKGMNKKILGEIDNTVGEIMSKEIKLFESNANFQEGCSKLTQELKLYKAKILESLEALRERE